MTNVGCELLGSPVGPPCFCYSSVLSKINDMLVYTSVISPKLGGIMIGMANYEKQETYPIPLSLPPMPHCLIYKDGVCNHLCLPRFIICLPSSFQRNDVLHEIRSLPPSTV